MNKGEEESKKEKTTPLLGVEYELELRDRDGKLLELRRRRSRTWVRFFIRLMQEMFANRHGVSRTFSYLDTGGTSRTLYVSTGDITGPLVALGVRAPAGTTSYGITVGSSDIAYSREHYSLQSKIPHGSASGQLLYGEVTVESVALEDSTERFRIIRTFTNSSGSPITVREIGIETVNQYGSAYYYFLLCRDVLPSPITIPDGATLTVRYRIFVSYA